MFGLTVGDARLAVRKNIDEVGLNDSDMLESDSDNASLDYVIARTLPEAINIIHEKAPTFMLDGEVLALADIKGAALDEDNEVLSFAINKDVLRIVAFKAYDSNITLTVVVPEDSPVGRMQLNKYTRGVYDNPVLVRMQSMEVPSGTVTPAQYNHYKYYTMSKDFDMSASQAISRCEFIERYVFDDSEGSENPGNESASSYSVAFNVVDKVIYQLTAMVLSIYGKMEQAEYFYKLSAF